MSQVDPILFRAGISEAEYLRLAKRVEETGQQASGAEIELILADGTVHPHTGRVEAVERDVDATTGTLAVQITFPNPNRLVRPGQYGRARFVVETKKGRCSCRSARCRAAEPLQRRDRRCRQQGRASAT